jgi:predicted nucleic acid-binding protein
LTGYVLDASVAAKWVLPIKGEPLAAESMRLLESFARGEINLSVPGLFWVEIGNILWKSVRAGRISEQTAYDAIQWFQALDVPTSPTKDLIGDAVAIAFAVDRSVYDGVYLALAIASGRSLVTADKRLFNAMGARFPVRWLGAVELGGI